MATGKIEFDGEDMFVFYGEKKIAKRGKPGTPQAGEWISLEPGYTVYTDTDRGTITVEFNGVRLQ